MPETLNQVEGRINKLKVNYTIHENDVYTGPSSGV
jgi:hypothetical protein